MPLTLTPCIPLSADYAQGLLPLRHKAAHKGQFGSLAVIGGSDGMLGALMLASRAALLSGSGRVFAVSLASQPPVVDINTPEVMYRDIDWLHDETKPVTAYVIGPGLGLSLRALDCLTFCLQQPLPVLLDADALNLIALHPDLQTMLQQRTAATVITPHPAEAQRLLNQTVDYIQLQRAASARLLAQRFNAVCVLKGSGSLIAPAASDDDDRCFINTSGNVGLASGGTGDVLSGIIGSLMAQGLSCMNAAKLGVYVHGAAADALVASGIGPIGLTASEVGLTARQVLNQLYAAQYG
ncbi:MAG TPA: NAD(P)H-hydrate dehydratase [Methylophilus sp.]